MKIPQIACKIEAYAAVNPSEDPEKVQQAISNVLQDMNFKYESGSIKGVSNDLQSLSKIYETIKSRKSRTYRRQMRYNLQGDTTWFYLNKQAAFVNVIALCEEAEESPLGPIKILLHSKNIDKVMEWLVPAPTEKSDD
ncbi:MAG: RNA-binding domain-containing protein [Nitrosopumilaceae archaeon]